MNPFYVTKANGERQDFDYAKFEKSLRRIGAQEDVIKEIELEIGQKAFDGITTHEIYKEAYTILHKKHKLAAIRYSLKKAIADLGPTGFPFERFVAEIFKVKGYETLTDQIVKGKCVDHEIDVIAWKEKELIMVEAKFHADFNLKSDLKIVLYVKARYDDILGNVYHYGNADRKLTEGWVITNTKFSSMAIQYAECQPGMRIVGWNYPYDRNLHHMIIENDLIPVTALTTITSAEKTLFISQGYVLSKQLLDENLLRQYHFDDHKINLIKTEVSDILSHGKEL